MTTLGKKGNRLLNINVADNELNLNEMGFDGQELINEMVERSWELGTIWIHSEEAHRDYIMEKLTISEILDACNEMEIDLAEYEYED